MPRGSPRYRAVVIGHTGRGNYGHGLDVALVGFPEVDIVAVADPDETGRRSATERIRAPRAYADYRTMLEREHPDLVVVAPRWVGARVAMVTAAAEIGAHVLIEKPLAATVAEADVLLAATRRARVKVAVAHQGRVHPATLHAFRLVREGAIGRLRLVHGYGKMDHRGGGQDLMVLGTHVLDLMSLFCGLPTWVSGELLAGSRLVEPTDVRAGDEEIGPIAGDGLRATYGFPNNVIGFFESFANLGTAETPYGVDLVGDAGQLSLRGGFTKPLLRHPHPYAVPGVTTVQWEHLDVPGAEAGDVAVAADVSPAELTRRANKSLVYDFLDAIAEDREPAASGDSARVALEMIQAVAAAHVAGGRVQLPLIQRTHPLSAFSESASVKTSNERGEERS